jgi:hypothetical protein
MFLGTPDARGGAKAPMSFYQFLFWYATHFQTYKQYQSYKFLCYLSTISHIFNLYLKNFSSHFVLPTWNPFYFIWVLLTSFLVLA